MTHMAVPSIDLSDLDLRHLEQKVVTVARDVAYITIGFSVLAFQRAQVRRVEAQRLAGKLAGTVTNTVTGTIAGTVGRDQAK